MRAIKNNKIINKNLTVAIALFIFISTVAFGSVQGDENDTILSIEEINIKQNDVNTAKVLIENVDNLGSFKLSIKFDTSILEVVNVDNGDMDKVFYFQNASEETLNITGYVITGFSSSQMCIAEIRFKAIGSVGSHSDLIFESSELLTGDPSPLDITHQTSDGKVTIIEGDSSGSSSGGSSGGTGGGTTNKAPIADASLSETKGFINTPITLDASNSYDIDGSIVGYRWDFSNDGNFDTDWLTEPIIEHVYEESGQYTVKLQVNDNNNQIDEDTIKVVISKANYRPIAPAVITGIRSGTIDVDYTFTVVTLDPDGDDLKYIVDWDDGSQITETDYKTNNIKTNVSHSWTKSGVYIIKLSAKDTENDVSDETHYEVFIDVDYLKIDEIDGYLIDNDLDGEYDQYLSLETERKIDLEIKEDGTYLIDIDDDGVFDYQYNENDGLTTYKESQNVDESSSNNQENNDIDESNLFTISVISIVAIVVLFIVFYLLKRKK